MAYKNIVFVKLEKRLLNDHRWYMMSDHAQLIYIKLILLAAETYNKIPRNEDVLIQALRSSLEIGMFKGAMQEIKTNFPKFKGNKHFYYFDEFEHKTNYIPVGKSQGTPKDVQRVCQNKNKRRIREDKGAAPTIYEYYSKTIKPGAKEDAVKSIDKLLKTGFTKEDLLGRVNDYKSKLAKDNTEPRFYIQANNFFGLKARYKDFEPIKVVEYLPPDALCKACKGLGKVQTGEGQLIRCVCVKEKK